MDVYCSGYSIPRGKNFDVSFLLFEDRILILILILMLMTMPMPISILIIIIIIIIECTLPEMRVALWQGPDPVGNCI